jgi:hypothetical protein
MAQQNAPQEVWSWILVLLPVERFGPFLAELLCGHVAPFYDFRHSTDSFIRASSATTLLSSSS